MKLKYTLLFQLFVVILSAQDAKECYRQGNLMLKNQDYQQAIDYYNKAIEQDSSYAFAINNKGRALFELQQYKQSVDCFDQVLALQPQNNKAKYQRGRANFSMAYYENSILDFSALLDDQEQHLDALYYRGKAYMEVERYSKAINDFKKLIEWRELDESTALLYQNAYTLLGMSERYSSQFDAAMKSLNRAIEINANDATALYNRAVIKVNNDEVAAGILDLTKSLKIDPANPIGFYQRGLAYKSNLTTKKRSKTLQKLSN